jgi:hypothetical protein
MRHVLIILLLLIGWISGVLAPSKQQTPIAQTTTVASTPTIDQIIDRYIVAIGGKAAFSKLSSRVQKGTVQIEGTSVIGETEDYQKAPNKRMLKTTMPGVGDIQQGFDGLNGWQRDPNSGLIDLRGTDLANLAFDAEFNKEIRLKLDFIHFSCVKQR